MMFLSSSKNVRRVKFDSSHQPEVQQKAQTASPAAATAPRISCSQLQSALTSSVLIVVLDSDVDHHESSLND